MNLLYKSCLILLFALSSTSVYAQGFFLDNTTVEYGQCNGIVTVRFPVYHNSFALAGNNCLSDGQLDHLRIFAERPNGSEQFLGTYVWDAINQDAPFYCFYNYHFPRDGLNCRGYNYCGADTKTEEAVGNIIFISLTFRNLDDVFFGNSTKIKVVGSWYGSAFDKTIIGPTQLKIEAPTGISAEVDKNCDYVLVKWTNPSNITSSCPNPNWWVDIYRDGGYLGNAGQAGQYKDSTAEKGQDYNYKVYARWHPFYTYRISNSAFSPETLGRRIGPLASPSDLQASDNICDIAEINVTWSYALNPAQGFVLERSTNAAFTGALKTFFLSGDVRSYRDNEITSKTTYWYRIKAKNECADLSPPSSSDTGISPAIPKKPSKPTVVVDNVNNKIRVTWQDLSFDEDKFVLVRGIVGAGSEEFDVATPSKAGTNYNVVYEDLQIDACQTYSYRIKAINDCGDSGESPFTTARLDPDLSNSFSGGHFDGSKGYFTNRVQLDWSLGGNSANIIESYKVSRRILGSNDAYILLQEISGGGIYNDLIADAGILYEYRIVGLASCETDQISSDTAYTIGFRAKSGQVTGNVAYAGGNAVANVKIVAESTTEGIGNSIDVDGGKIVISPNANQNLTNELIVESWIRPEAYNNSFGVVEKSGSYRLYYDHPNQRYAFEIQTSGAPVEISIPRDSLPTGNWNHIAGQVTADSIFLFVNGMLLSSGNRAALPISNPAVSDIVLYNGFEGKVTQLRLWKKAKTQDQIFRDYSRYVNGSEAGLFVFLPMNEGAGSYAYDRSRSSVSTYNKNHAQLMSGAQWPLISDIPTRNQLSFAAYTDTSGNYLITLPYINAGENYTLTPIFKTHEFDPKERLLFVGDGSTVINNIDFLDKSSFEMTGTLFYLGTNCPVKDAFLKIDGDPVTGTGGILVKTDAAGDFSVQVPIGKHYVEIDKIGHTFSAGRWPVEEGEVFDFQEPLPDIPFKDNTLMKVVGRAVGGTVEGDKVPGLGRSVNNIGQATITLHNTLDCGWITDSINNVYRRDTTFLTDPATGEYIVELPPLKYKVSRVELLGDPTAIDFGSFNDLDLRQEIELGLQLSPKTEVDTVYIPNTVTIDSIGSITYHKEANYIYRSTPSIDVTTTSGDPFMGESSATFVHSKYPSQTLDLTTNNLLFPVFISGKDYNTEIHVFEAYTNIDNGLTDRVPVVKGALVVNNALAENPVFQLDLEASDTLQGVIPYSFRGGSPALLENTVDVAYSFTKTFNISVTDPNNTYRWEPFDYAAALAPSAESFYRGYLFGTKSIDGTNFVTQGPSVVDYILRDPPGGESFAVLQKGSSLSKTVSWNISGGVGAELNTVVYGGPKFATGFGLVTETEVTNVITLGAKVEVKAGGGGAYTTTTTTTTDWTTSSNPNNVGAGSDLFIGTSQNYNFGLTEELGIFPVSVCDSNAIIDCFGAPVGGFRVGKTERFYIAPGEVETSFFLTQKDIINFEIPYLINLRNDKLNTDPKYTCVICDENDPRYGKNNDDSVFPNPSSSALPAANPPSYIFSESHPDSIDMIRKFNEQIRLWEEALALNERDKIEVGESKQNWSFDGGGSSLTRSITNDTVTVSDWSFELNLGASLNFLSGGKVGGVGAEVENKILLTASNKEAGNTTTTATQTVAYTLTDGDIWDRYSVDVFDSPRGYGPVFKISAGETSCPHEGELRSKYYNPGTLISTGTIQLEQPRLSVDNDLLVNIPDDGTAEFVFRMGNASTQGWIYRLGLLNHTNPGGAIIVNSGTSELGSEFTIPSGGEVQQRILIERGGAYIHDSLLFVLQSTCQYDIGNDFDADIGDSVYISVHFIPACSDIRIHRPNQNWILNKSYNNRMDIIMADYDVNTQNFEKFTLQYRPSNEALWSDLHTYYKDTSGVTGADFSEISKTNSSSTFVWDVDALSDTEYDLRAVTDCTIATTESEIVSGYMDRQTIEVFGTPSPADGILDPNDDILLTMNETIETGGITSLNFDVRGVLNGTPLRHETSLAFDGVDDYATIPEYQLQQRSMVVEFWLKRSRLGEEIIVSQGNSSSDQLTISFDASNRLRFQLGAKVLTSNSAITDQDWRHYAVVYDRAKLDAEIYLDYVLDKTDNSFGTDYNSTGPIYIGRHEAGGLPMFKGFMHELRLWSVPRTVADIASKGLVTLSGRESGLIGNWPLDEGFGIIAYDKVRSRHAQISGSTWNILPQNHSFAFDGTSDYLEALGAGSLGFSDESDLTIEAWFKTGASTAQSILSNGKADGTRPEDFAWNLYVNAAGAVVLENDGNRVSTPVGFNDNNWHHFTAVVERTRAVSIYIDGDLVSTGNAADFKGFVGPKLWVGSRGWYVGSTEMRDQYFSGNLDDIRIWNIARKAEQIKRDFVHQLVGDELGLQAYFPFDGVTSPLGKFLRNADLKDGSANAYDLTLGGTTVESFSEDAPPIKLPRLIEKVNITYSINNDQIFIEVTDPPARIENVTLDITVRGLKDLAGNFMESPETWIAYIDKNQVFWEQEYFQFEKKLEDNLSFKAKIKNTGGSQESFSLGNLPSWLTATPSSGLIDPNSTIEVTFRVQPLLNIGEYEQDVFVTTESFGFNERLLLDLKIIVDPPDWTIDPSLFSSSMNITGELAINDIISTDTEDMVSVWVDGLLRGSAYVEYDPSSGKHLVFLTILSNADNFEPPPIEKLEFRAWDASRGRLLIDLMPNDFTFLSNQILGSRTTPIRFEATVLTELEYALSPGWNWISFPLASTQLSTVPGPMSQLSPNEGDEIKSKNKFLTRDSGIWDGSLTAYNTMEAYKVKVTDRDTFRYSGTFIDPSTEPIAIIPGWNWISVKSEFIIDIPSAMSALDPKTGDLIKGQRSFAIYEDGFGWGGNLDFLEPQQGYMLKYHTGDLLTFPGNLNVKPSNPAYVKSMSNKYVSNSRLKNAGCVLGTYSSNMSLTAEIDSCLLLDNVSGSTDLADWQLAAYAGTECRGIIDSKWEPAVGSYLFYLSIEGDQVVELSFKLIHKSNGSEIPLNEVLDFRSNEWLGIPSDPVLFTCSVDSNCVNERMFRTGDLDLDKDNMIEQAQISLQSDAQIPIGYKLILKAGGYIELLKDFEINTSSQLELIIEDCVTPKN